MIFLQFRVIVAEQTGVWIDLLDDLLDFLEVRMGGISGERQDDALSRVDVSTWGQYYKITTS